MSDLQSEKRTEERTETHACDLISRQVAIDALCDVCGKACDKSKFVYNAPQDEQVILCPEHYCPCTLPSAQPDITDEQAIEHLQKSGWMQSHDKQMYEAGLRERLADDSGSYDALLPSAQPEIIRCKNCAWWQRDWSADGKSCCYCPMVDTNTGADFYCANAEREDRHEP